MAQAAFVVVLDLPSVDPSTIEATNERLWQEVEDAGFIVVKVDPWDRAALLPDAVSQPALESGNPFQSAMPQDPMAPAI